MDSDGRRIARHADKFERLYDPRSREHWPGASHEARVYWEAGSATVDFCSPLAYTHQ